jgi:hypothetical protein
VSKEAREFQLKAIGFAMPDPSWLHSVILFKTSSTSELPGNFAVIAGFNRPNNRRDIRS